MFTPLGLVLVVVGGTIPPFELRTVRVAALIRRQQKVKFIRRAGYGLSATGTIRRKFYARPVPTRTLVFTVGALDQVGHRFGEWRRVGPGVLLHGLAGLQHHLADRLCLGGSGGRICTARFMVVTARV
jgi:hypothetical protein